MKKLLVIIAILTGHQLYGASNTISVYPANTLMLSNAIAGLGAIITNLFEPKITGTTTNDYWSGAKTWINFTNSVANYWNYRTTTSNYWSAINTFAGGLDLGGSSITNLSLLSATNNITVGGTNVSLQGHLHPGSAITNTVTNAMYADTATNIYMICTNHSHVMQLKLMYIAGAHRLVIVK